jgi:hypothetical protein
MSVEIHPLALLIPEIAADQFAELRSDIESNGLLQPIVLYEGKVLDGRNRLRACTETGVAPRFESFTGASPVGFVLSLNVKRRHLTASQRAAIAVEFLPALEAEARERQGTRTDLTTSGSKEPEVVPVPNRARVEAGALAGVSGASVDRAKRVKREAPEMFEQVKAGTLPVTTADRAVRERKTSTPRNPIKQWAMPPAAKVVPRVLAGLRVHATEMDRALREGSIQPGEAADWSRDLSDVMRTLRACNAYLKEQF